jgi:hypothetical protein
MAEDVKRRVHCSGRPYNQPITLEWMASIGEWMTDSESTTDGIETDVNLVLKVGGAANAHQRTSRVNVLLPPVKFLVVLHGKPNPSVSGFEKKTIRLEVRSFDIGDIL